MKHLALLVEWHVEDDVPGDQTLAAISNLIAVNSPRYADNVTAFAGIPADVLTDAATAGQLVSQAQRLHLQPDDVVTVTLNADQADADLEHLTDVAEATFPDHKVVFAWKGTTVQAGPEA